MADEMKHAWSEVGGRFSALGDAVKQRTKATATAADAVDASTDDDDDRSALRDAIDKLKAAAKDFGDKAATVVKDPEVRAHTKDAAHSLNAALSATVDQIGGEVDSLVKRAKGSGGKTDPPA
jgi:hypothetical protein